MSPSHLEHEGPALTVVATLAAGLILTWQASWQGGLYVVGAAFVLGAALRLALPTRRAGLLAVRGKTTDTLMLTMLGVAVVVLAAVVPPPRR